MVGTKHIVSHEFQYSADTITLDSRTQMSHMHVLSNVWTWEINNNSLITVFNFFFILLNSQLLRVKDSYDFIFNKLIL